MLLSHVAIVGLVMSPHGPPTMTAGPIFSSIALRMSILEKAGGRGFDLWGELAEPFAEAAGVPYEPSGPLQQASEFEKAMIDRDQFGNLLTTLGETLTDEKIEAMFAAADKDSDGKLEFVQVYKAILDEARSSTGGGSWFGGLFGGE